MQLPVQLYYSLKRLTAPTVAALPLTDAELMRAARLIDADTQLDELKAKCLYAMDYIEDKTKHVCLQQTYTMTLRRFPMLRGQPYNNLIAGTGYISLPRSPVQSITSVEYTDTNGTVQTLDPSGYQYNIERDIAILGPARLLYWPLTDPWSFIGVRVTFTAGYATNDDVPIKYKEALKFLALYRFFNRESDADGEIPKSLRMLVNSLDIGWQD